MPHWLLSDMDFRKHLYWMKWGRRMKSLGILWEVVILVNS